MEKILITGGPVHGKIDDVKLVTNKFKGGRMAALADRLSKKYEIIYLCSKGSIEPKSRTQVVYHDGVHDYMDKVIEITPKCEAVILGAAVANLIPVKPFEGKFPSHDYKSGDVIPIDFQIAPRIVDRVKEVNPKVKLFAFKLLSGVSHETLIEAAYDIVLESKAVCVFANDAKDLDTKYAVTKEHSVIPLKETDYHNFIIDRMEEEYFSTTLIKDDFDIEPYEKDIKHEYENMKDMFKHNGKYMFGTIAMRVKGTNSFITTIRGKEDFSEFTLVKDVNFDSKMVFSTKKATLNAPLLYKIFKDHPEENLIIHTHKENELFETLEYATPGTLTDSLRETNGIFNIRFHGSFQTCK